MAVFYAILGVALLVWFALAWLTGTLLGLTGTSFLILFASLAILGTIAAGVVAWWKLRTRTELPADLAAASQAGTDEIDLVVKDAEAKLAASKLAGTSHLPLVYLIGDAGSAKTTTIVQSGVEPELLAGQVYGESNAVAPTRVANLWFAQNTIFAEAAPKVLAEPARWVRLVRKLRPGSLKSVVGGSTQSPRAAVVCVNSEIFTQAGGADQLTTLARTLSARLGEVSQALGISFPVYVLFTRADRLPFFADYVRTLSNDEASQVLGATLPLRTARPGVYAEEEGQRLNAAFGGLFHSLADRRIDLLAREADAVKTAGIYEFPREFRKLRGPMVQFLVDLCRPSQLRSSPFLRGFYFSGVRPVTVQDAPVVAPAPQPQRQTHSASSATQVFQVPSFQQAAAPVAAQYSGTKRVPQWVFLSRLFHGIILQDRAGFSASASSTRTSTAQRVLLGAAAFLLLLLALGWTVSYFKNRALVGDAVAAAEAIPAGDAAGANLASPESLQKLESLRQSLEQLTAYKRDGHPFSMGLGLYAGDDAYPAVRAAYYNRFQQLLFRQAQGGLVAHLNGLPVAPGPGDNNSLSYDVLKGYLITTTANDKVSETSPAPVLLNRWAEGRNPDPQRLQLADKQFRFYASDLKNGNPFSSAADVNAVARGRSYLSQFSGLDRVYQFMLSSAGKASVNYNRDIKDSAQAVLNNREVPGAFTKEGYAWMQDALRRADQFVGGERWVLCEATGNVPATTCASGAIDRGKLVQELSARYITDYINAWRNYFKGTAVLRYADLKDAARKLNAQAGPQSPILGLFWLASQHTALDYSKIPGADRIQKAFQSVHAVVPPGQLDRYVAAPNAPYHGALGSLQTAIDAASNMPTPDPGTVSNTLNSATNAKGAIRQVAQGFTIDQDAHLEQTVQRLLEEPITNAEALLRAMGPKELNGKGAQLCAQISPVLNKFPFNPGSPQDATVPEVNSVLKPGEGAFWAFYEMNLKPALAKQGDQYVATGAIPLNPTFVGYFNSMARFSQAFYKGGTEPKLTYTVRPLKSEGIQDLMLHIDGQQLPAASGAAKQFTWPGGNPGAKFTGKLGSSDLPAAPVEGLWAAFRLFNGADTFEQAGTGYNLEWILQASFGGGRLANANAPRARFFVDLGGAPLIFRKGTAGLRCVPTVAK